MTDEDRQTLVTVILQSVSVIADLQYEIRRLRAACRYMARDQNRDAEELLTVENKDKETTDRLVEILGRLKEFEKTAP